jgi:Leu/Phe-tRNA-protein transferase
MLLKDMTNDYYWCDEWDCELYVQLAKMGFISTSYDTKDGLVLLPELQFNYGILDFKNLHISRKVKKLLKRHDAKLSFNTRLDEVLQKITFQHQNNWLKGEYAELLKKLYNQKNKYKNFEIFCVELISKETNELIAGEIGYKIGKTYTSLSGFSSKEKKYNNYGKLQLTLLAQYLEKNGFAFWNLGHPHMLYKKDLGSKTYKRDEFLQRWQEAIV